MGQATMTAQGESVLKETQFKQDGVNKVNNFTGSDLTTDTYYFRPGQVLKYHRHPEGDQVFFVFQGTGKFFLDNGSEEVIDVQAGSIVYVPAGVWHQLENNGTQDLIASQCTRAGAGMENRS